MTMHSKYFNLNPSYHFPWDRPRIYISYTINEEEQQGFGAVAGEPITMFLLLGIASTDIDWSMKLDNSCSYEVRSEMVKTARG
ncbi:hypothetical protein Prudu_982S000100 [Prunus dulcis]|uniref:Uncharacterized protein n=1 Tax=Prunus dulcis TaxID=3755 RepID=A0A5H2Y5K2_PRUDU|nr:hypothetical protein Prudu_982S000100 [Prunus dulcis]